MVKKLIRVTVDEESYELAKEMAKRTKVFFNDWVGKAIAEKARKEKEDGEK